MGQVMTLCTSDEADEHGYDRTTVEKASRAKGPLCIGHTPSIPPLLFFRSFFPKKQKGGRFWWRWNRGWWRAVLGVSAARILSHHARSEADLASACAARGRALELSAFKIRVTFFERPGKAAEPYLCWPLFLRVFFFPLNNASRFRLPTTHKRTHLFVLPVGGVVCKRCCHPHHAVS